VPTETVGTHSPIPRTTDWWGAHRSDGLISFAVPTNRAPVAQLDRAPGFEPVGRGFKSLRAHQVCSARHLRRSRSEHPNAPVAQLDRALASGAKGRRFESCRARQTSFCLPLRESDGWQATHFSRRPPDSPSRALARRFDGSLRFFPRSFAPRTPRHALSLAASTAHSDRVGSWHAELGVFLYVFSSD
jgi:hypothetical protein